MLNRLRANHKFTEDHIKIDSAKKLGLDKLYLPRDIPRGLDEFYSKFHPLDHPDTREPVKKLADHQREVWDDQFTYLYRAYPKSQKIFLSTTFLLEDIRHALTDAMGMQIIIIAQSVEHARTHLSDFKKLVLESEYKDYLITRPIPEIGLERNEITKATIAYMHNPKNPFRPTRIYAFGPNPGSLISFKQVKHVHASDITRSNQKSDKQKETLASILSRLGPAKGSLVLEAPFRGMEGPFFEQWEKFQEITQKGVDLSELSKVEQQGMPFYFKQYDYTYGLLSGAFTKEFIEGERIRWGPLFGMYYEAKPYESDRSWFTPDLIKTSDEATEFFAGLGF